LPITPTCGSCCGWKYLRGISDGHPIATAGVTYLSSSCTRSRSASSTTMGVLHDTSPTAFASTAIVSTPGAAMLMLTAVAERQIPTLADVEVHDHRYFVQGKRSTRATMHPCEMIVDTSTRKKKHFVRKCTDARWSSIQRKRSTHRCEMSLKPSPRCCCSRGVQPLFPL